MRDRDVPERVEVVWTVTVPTLPGGRRRWSKDLRAMAIEVMRRQRPLTLPALRRVRPPWKGKVYQRGAVMPDGGDGFVGRCEVVKRTR